MKIKKITTILSSSDILTDILYTQTHQDVEDAIKKVDWPIGTGKFTIYPESGKKRGQGNGVKPIKVNFIKYLKMKGWATELSVSLGTGKKVGDFDAILIRDGNIVALEWETGNVSSSHRSLNKMAFFIQKQVIMAGFLVIPCRSLAQYLTDRIGNFEELEPYFEFWQNSIAGYKGLLEIIGIEQDDVSYEVPRIPKGTDGRSLN